MGQFKYVGDDRSDEAIVYVHPDGAGESRHVFEPGEVVDAAQNPDETCFAEVDGVDAAGSEPEADAEPVEVPEVEREDPFGA